MTEVVRMLNTYHGGHHRVYNLCSEKQYDAARFTDGDVRAYPFDDHEVPALDLLFAFIRCAPPVCRSRSPRRTALLFCLR